MLEEDNDLKNDLNDQLIIKTFRFLKNLFINLFNTFISALLGLLKSLYKMRSQILICSDKKVLY